jgi:hypothetical protein
MKFTNFRLDERDSSINRRRDNLSAPPSQRCQL